jgi:outer membrane protein
MCRILILILFWVFFAAPGLRAQGQLVPLEDLVHRVVGRDAGVKAYQAERDAARSETRRAETARIPKLYVSTDVGGGKVVNDVSNVLLTGLSPASVTDPKTRSRLADLSADRPFFLPSARLESLLYDGGKTGALIRSARLGEDKAEVAQGRVSDDEAYSTAKDFLELAEGRVTARSLEDHLRVAELASQALDEQAQAGRIIEARALTGRAQLRSAQAALANNRDDLRTTSDLLRERAGLPADAAFDTRPLEAFLESFTLAALPDEVALEGNPQAQAAVLDTRIQEEAVRAAKSRKLPEVRFVAEYGFVFSSLLFTFRPGYTVAVRANYPLFTGREVERNIQTEVRRLSASTWRERKAHEEIQEDFTRLQAENRKLGRRLDAARSDLAQSQELYRITRLKFDQGAASPSDLLEAAQLVLNSHQRCLELTRSSLLLRWAAFRLEGKLLAELERRALP